MTQLWDEEPYSSRNILKQGNAVYTSFRHTTIVKQGSKIEYLILLSWQVEPTASHEISIQIVAMTSKFPGRPTTPMAAWKPARTCEKTIQHIPCKSILMNRWCFCLQVAMREFLLTIYIRYQAEFQVMRIKKYKFEEYYLIQYKILRTNIWRVVIKDVNQWMTQATSEKKNSGCSW